MTSYKIGFASSWHSLTSEKGWIKPVAILTLIGWIPILGQIALLGYGLEWARLTAWGVDAAPKRSGVKYGKVGRTGAIALCVAVTMGIVLSILNVIVFGTGFAAAAFPALTSSIPNIGMFLSGSVDIVLYLLMLVVNLFMGTFISIAMMRATIYDSFTAGWRLDRLVQMVASDVTGFVRVYLVSLVGGILNWLYAAALAFVGALVVGAGFVGFAYSASVMNMTYDMDASRLLYLLLGHIGPSTVLMLAIAAIALLFAGGMLGTAVQLVSTHAVGQWFRRFDVARWGVSSDHLPEGTPVVTGSGAPTASGDAGAPVAPDATASKPVAEPAAPSMPEEAPKATMPATPAPEHIASAGDSSAPTTAAIPLPPVATDPAPAEDVTPGAEDGSERHVDVTSEDLVDAATELAHGAEGLVDDVSTALDHDLGDFDGGDAEAE